MSGGSWDAMLEAEAAGRISSQAGLASMREGRESELQRRRVLARLTKPELIEAVISAEGLVTSVPVDHDCVDHAHWPCSAVNAPRTARQVSPDTEIVSGTGVE